MQLYKFAGLIQGVYFYGVCGVGWNEKEIFLDNIFDLFKFSIMVKSLSLNVLALEPYFGGSHKAFLDGWSGKSCHSWTVLSLPPYKWKWRMRHSAVTFAEQVSELLNNGKSWDIIFCSDMLNLAEFLGLAPLCIKKLPTVAYFHENQLTYPARFESERDYQFVVTNMTTALAATSVWFNSSFHRDSFLGALPKFLQKMPDHQLIDAVDKIRNKAQIHPPGIDIDFSAERKVTGPMRILWAARAEHDKNPEDFFNALKVIKQKGIDFRLGVIGQTFREASAVFGWAKGYFADNIDMWGYQETRDDYKNALAWADLIVSTATHEFFGISAAEAIAAGAYPVLPNRLAYPELIGFGKIEGAEEFLYGSDAKDLAARLISIAERIESGHLWDDKTRKKLQPIERFKWENLVPVLDSALEQVAKQFHTKE